MGEGVMPLVCTFLLFELFFVSMIKSDTLYRCMLITQISFLTISLIHSSNISKYI